MVSLSSWANTKMCIRDRYLESSPADEQYEFTIVAGTIRNNAEAVLNDAGLTEDLGNYAFEKAVVHREEDGEEQEIEIVSRIGNTIYYLSLIHIYNRRRISGTGGAAV